MAIRDLLWGCPLCRAPGAIRQAGRRERCTSCGARFARAAGALIAVEHAGMEQVQTAGQWVARLGPVRPPEPAPDGTILGPELVRTRESTRQDALRLAGEFLGFVEVYGRERRGLLVLRTDGLLFRPRTGDAEHWTADSITGLQPASSAIQLGFHTRMVSIRFVDGSVRLWTTALSSVIRSWHCAHGREVRELQPFVRTAPLPARNP